MFSTKPRGKSCSTLARCRLLLCVHNSSPSGYSDASRQLYRFLIMTSNWVGSRCGQGRRSSTVPVTFLNVLGRCTAPPFTTSFRSFARKSSGMLQRIRTGAVTCGCCKIQPPSWRNPDSTVPLSWARAPAEGDSSLPGYPEKVPAEVRSLASPWFDFRMHPSPLFWGVSHGTESMDKYPECSDAESSKLDHDFTAIPMLRHSPTASTASTELTEKTGPQARSRWALPGLSASLRAVGMHLLKHTGVGIVCAVAYFDP